MPPSASFNNAVPSCFEWPAEVSSLDSRDLLKGLMKLGLVPLGHVEVFSCSSQTWVYAVVLAAWNKQGERIHLVSSDEECETAAVVYGNPADDALARKIVSRQNGDMRPLTSCSKCGKPQPNDAMRCGPARTSFDELEELDPECYFALGCGHCTQCVSEKRKSKRSFIGTWKIYGKAEVTIDRTLQQEFGGRFTYKFANGINGIATLSRHGWYIGQNCKEDGSTSNLMSAFRLHDGGLEFKEKTVRDSAWSKVSTYWKADAVRLTLSIQNVVVSAMTDTHIREMISVIETTLASIAGIPGVASNNVDVAIRKNKTYSTLNVSAMFRTPDHMDASGFKSILDKKRLAILTNVESNVATIAGLPTHGKITIPGIFTTVQDVRCV